MQAPIPPPGPCLGALSLALGLVACAGDEGPTTHIEAGVALDAAAEDASAVRMDSSTEGADSGRKGDATMAGDASVANNDVDAGDSDAGDELHGRSRKRGVAYNFCDWSTSHGVDDLRLLRTGTAPGSGIRWTYNWGPAPTACIADALTESPPVEFVPMAWGLTHGGADCASGGVCFNDGLTRADLVERIPDSSRYLLGFNEPNFAHQSNLTPTVAARAWTHLEHVADARGLALVGPATNFCDPSPSSDHAGSCTAEPNERSFDFGDYTETFPAGYRYNAFEWAELFYDECSTSGVAGRDCRIDYQAGHVYSWWGLGWYVDIFKRKAGLEPATEAHCDNGVEDDDEFGVDCGGNDCAACTAWARAQFAKALWITEFAPATDDAPATDAAQRIARTSEYIASELPRLESDPFVFRYAWFMPKTDIVSLDHVDLLSESTPVERTTAGITYLNQEH